LYDGQEAYVRTEMEETNSFQIDKGVRQGCILSPALFNFYAKGMMRRGELDETEDGVRHGGRIINNLRYGDDVTLLAGNEDSLRRILPAMKSAGEEVGLYLNVQPAPMIFFHGLYYFNILFDI